MVTFACVAMACSEGFYRRRFWKNRVIQSDEPLATVQLKVDKVEYGCDTGVLTWHGQFLNFEGERTCFCLAKCDISPNQLGSDVTPVLSLLPSKGSISVVVDWMGGDKKGETEHLRRWFREVRGERAASLFPPLKVNPNGVFGRWSPFKLILIAPIGIFANLWWVASQAGGIRVAFFAEVALLFASAGMMLYWSIAFWQRGQAFRHLAEICDSLSAPPIEEHSELRVTLSTSVQESENLERLLDA